MEELPLNEIEAIVTSDTLVAEGALHYLRDQEGAGAGAGMSAARCVRPVVPTGAERA